MMVLKFASERTRTHPRLKSDLAYVYAKKAEILNASLILLKTSLITNLFKKFVFFEIHILHLHFLLLSFAFIMALFLQGSSTKTHVAM